MHPTAGKRKLSKYNMTDAEICFPRYVKLNNAREYLLFLEADLKKLQEVCDTWVNIPGKGAVSLKPLCNIVVLKITDSNCAQDPYCRHNEVDIYDCNPISCRTATQLNGLLDPIAYLMFNLVEFTFFVTDEKKQYYLLSPFRYTDNGILMVNERELLGFPTSYAVLGNYFFNATDSIRFKKVNPCNFFSKPGAEKFQCAAMMHFEFPEDSVILNEYAEGGINTLPEVLFELLWKQNDVTGDEKHVDAQEITHHIFEKIRSLLPDSENRDSDAHQMTHLLLQTRRYISLIQFRDIVKPDNAMIQTVFTIAGQQNHIIGGGISPHPIRVNFEFWKMHSVNQFLKTTVQNKKNVTQPDIIENIQNNYHIVETLGLSDKGETEFCYVDASYSLTAEKIIQKNK